MVDWIDAEWFAERAKASAEGDAPALAQPENWAIGSERRMTELKAARAALVDVFDGGAKDVAPQEAAYAQASYDCWVEQQEEGWQELHIALCRNQFLRAARALDVAIRDELPDLEGRLFFEFDEYDLTPEARDKLAAIAEDLRAEGVDEVVIVGHADTVGTDQYNYALSESRAKTVANALTGMGVEDVSVETDVTLVAEGETAPLVETGEGVRMPLNRRVAVFAGEPSVGIATR
jgi:OOP family OmpA-OmpF porin